MKWKTLLLILSTFTVLSCSKDKASPVIPGDCGTYISYNDDIKPIINTSCVTNAGVGCHDAWIFEYDKLIGPIEDGRFNTEVFELKTMPLIPNDFGIDSLTDDEIKTFKCWIEQGYPEN